MIQLNIKVLAFTQCKHQCQILTTVMTYKHWWPDTHATFGCILVRPHGLVLKSRRRYLWPPPSRGAMPFRHMLPLSAASKMFLSISWMSLMLGFSLSSGIRRPICVGSTWHGYLALILLTLSVCSILLPFSICGETLSLISKYRYVDRNSCILFSEQRRTWGRSQSKTSLKAELPSI